MPIRRLLAWGVLALAGLGLVAALAVATTRLAAEPVGLSSEPLTGGDRLAPAPTAPPAAPVPARQVRPAPPAARRTRTHRRVRHHRQVPPPKAAPAPAAPLVTTSTASTAAPVAPAARTTHPEPAESSSERDGKNDSHSTPDDSSDDHGRAEGDD